MRGGGILNFQNPLNGSKVTIFSLLCTKKSSRMIRMYVG